MDVTEAQEAKQLRDENTRLRELVADLSLDKEALRSVIRKTDGARSDEGSCRVSATAVRLQSVFAAIAFGTASPAAATIFKRFTLLDLH